MSKTSRLVLCLVSVFAMGSVSTAQAGGSVAIPVESPRRAVVDYTTGFDFEDYNSVREAYPTSGYFRSWGEHPIIWKSLVNPQLDFDPWTFDPNQGPLLFQGVPQGLTIDGNDSAALDNYEASGAFTNGGATVDPTGHWIQTFIAEGEEAAVHAAMAIWEWNSPVYINFTYDDGEHITAVVGVIDRVTLSTPGGVPHEVCNWGGSPNPNPLQHTTATPGCPGLVVEAVKMTYYSDVLLCCSTVDYYDGDELTGAEFVTLYEQSFDSGHVLYDPPASGFEHFTPGELQVLSPDQAASVALRKHGGSLVLAK